jgi:hypothetical protein
MPPKPIRISPHARFEMGRRRIRRGEVIAVIRKPGQIVPSIKGRQIYQAKVGPSGRMLLRVVVKEDARAYHVVTAYKTSKVTRYWGTP